MFDFLLTTLLLTGRRVKLVLLLLILDSIQLSSLTPVVVRGLGGGSLVEISCPRWVIPIFEGVGFVNIISSGGVSSSFVFVFVGGSVVRGVLCVTMWISPILDRGGSEGSPLANPNPMWWVFPIFAGGVHCQVSLCLSDCRLRRYWGFHTWYCAS